MNLLLSKLCQCLDMKVIFKVKKLQVMGKSMKKTRNYHVFQMANMPLL